MACDPKVYSNVSPEVMAGLRKELAAIELVLPETDQGVLESAAFNVKANYNFNRASGEMKVEITDKPFFVPCSYIFGKLDEAFDRARKVA